MLQHRYLKALSSLLLITALTACTPPEEKKVQYFNNGKALYEKGDYIKSRIEFSNALQIDPKYSDALYMRGLVELRKNNIRNAFNDLHNATQLNPQNLPAQIELIKLLLLTKNIDQAKEKITGLENEFSTNNDFLFIKARYLFQVNELDKCEEILASLLEKKYQNDEAHVLLSYALLKQRKLHEAEDVLLHAMKIFPSSIALKTSLVNVYDIQGKENETKALLQDLLAAEPDNNNHKLAYSKFLFKTGNKDEAVQFLKKTYLEHVNDISFLTNAVQLLNATNNANTSEDLLKIGLEKNKDNFEIRHMLSILLSSKGQYKEAEQILLDCLNIDKNPSNPKVIETNTILAQVHYNFGNLEQAKNYINTVLSNNPKSTQGLLLKAQIDYVEGKLEDAIAGYRTVIADRPNTAELYIQLSEIYLKNNQKELAILTLRDAQKTIPDNGKIQIILARLYIQNKDYASSEDILKKYLASSPKDINGYVELAKLYAIQKKYDLSEKQLLSFIEKFPENVLGYIHLKNLYLVTRDTKKTIEAIKKGITAKPDSLLLNEELVKLYLANGEHEKAVALCQGKINNNENTGFYFNLLGTISLSKRDYAKAEDYFNKSNELVPEWTDPYNNLATALAMQGKQDTAINKLEESIGVNPKDNKSYAMLAALYEKSGNTQKAITTYEKALQQFPRDWATANNLAYLLGERAQGKEELERALKLANTAYFLNRDNPTVLDTLGWVNFKIGNYAKAIQLLTDAVEKNPQQALWNYHLGAALAANGQKSEAVGFLQKSIEDEKESSWKTEAQRLLDETK